MIDFKCSQCGTRIVAPPNRAGQTGKCPKCGELNRVPAGTMAATPARQPTPGDHRTELNQATAATRDAAPGQLPVSPAPRPRHYGKPPWIVMAIVGGIAAVGVGGYLVVRLAMPNGAPNKGAQEPDPAQNERELARLRAENAQLNATLTKAETDPPTLPVRAAPEPPKPPLPSPTTASPLVPKGVTVSGAAYVVRRSGQSDILRGFRVTVIQRSVPEEVCRKSFTTVVQDYRSLAVEKRKAAAKWNAEDSEVFGHYAKALDEYAKQLDGKAEEYSQFLAKVNGPADSANVLRLLGAACYENISAALAAEENKELDYIRKSTAESRKQVVRDFVESIKIAATSTDVQGAYKFTDAPTSAYIFAMFDTADGFMIWAIPVQGSGSKDLFNDTALVLK